MSTGVRFVGKDPDGIAKAISVNDDGVLLAELSGSLLVGEVVENPTANTLLARLKSLEDKIDKITNGTTPAVTQLSGSNVCLSTEEKPEGQQGDTLLEYNEATGETKVYKYISGDWREL